MRICYLALSFCLAFAACSNAKEKKFPPYPDIWGYDLTDDFNQDVSLDLSCDLMKNGDYLLRYPSTKTPDNSNTDYTLLFFFEQRKEVFKGIDAAMEYFREVGFEYGPGVKPYIILNDKTKDRKIIDINTNSRVHIKYHRMNSMHDTFVQRLDEFGYGKPVDYKLSPIGITTFCKKNKACTNWAYSLARRIIKLEDNTFFIFEPHYPLFLRFDRDFKTKFKPQRTMKLDDNRELKSNFYILPYSKIEYFFDQVAQGYIGEYTDDINNQFLDYLYDEEQKGNISHSM